MYRRMVCAAAVMALGVAWSSPGQEPADSSAMVSADEDIAIVAEILRTISSDTVVPSGVTKTAGGRVVSLNLSNQVLGTAGLKQIPDRVFTLTGLQELYLSKNVLSALPFELTELKKLRVLDVGDNEISEVPSWIGDLQNLERLDLRNNEFSDLPASLYTLKKLKYLQMWGNDLSTLSDDISKLTSLEELYLERNRLKSLPVTITKMKALKYLDYGYNYLCNLPPAVHEWMVKKDKKYKSLQKCW